MRIALRTGGGRGVYELAGRQGDTPASDLFDHSIYYELTPGIVIPGRAVASRRSGKPRILLDERKRTTHFYRLLAAVLLLPKPKREFKTTHGTELVKYESYSITAIKVDVADLGSRNVILRPTDLLLENADHLQGKVEFAQRMSRITRVWEAASHLNTPLAKIVNSLEEAVLAENPDYKAIENHAQEISDFLGTDVDPLPIIERQFGLTEATQEHSPLLQTQQFTHQADFGVDDSTSQLEARLERVKQWRQIAVRGAAGRQFSRDVTSHYEFRCLFSGQRLPKTEATDSPGVDAAHILPWSTHNINAVPNGLCLNKLCHWAFDAGVVKLFYDDKSNAYVLDIPQKVRKAAKKTAFDLDYFEAFTGQIPLDHLPRNKNFWPAPKYLDELNKFMEV